MTLQTANLLLYLCFWAVFVIGTCITFRLAAAAIHLLDNELPCRTPPPYVDAGHRLECKHVRSGNELQHALHHRRTAMIVQNEKKEELFLPFSHNGLSLRRKGAVKAV